MSLYLFYVFPAVVGVKLNVSFWMNSFMNATLKLNVSQFKRASLEKNRRPLSLISSLAVFDNLGTRINCQLSFSRTAYFTLNMVHL